MTNDPARVTCKGREFRLVPKEEVEAAKARAGTFDYQGTIDKIQKAAEAASVLADVVKNPSFEFTGEQVDLRPKPELRCPDGGYCHHPGCTLMTCFRVLTCGPLSGKYPDDQWPADLVKVHRDNDAALHRFAKQADDGIE